MKARVKGTGEILEIASYATIPMECCDSFGEPLRFYLDDVEILPEGKDIKESEVPDYWEKLLHQYAGMAMQGILANSAFDGVSVADIAITSIKLATSLIKRLKEERK